MTSTYAIANQKGGVGKTTTSINLAAALAHLGKKVLLVDLDPQGNATTGSGVEKDQLNTSIYNVLTGRCSADEAIIPCLEAGFDLIPANGDLTAAEVELMQISDREKRLKNAFQSLKGRYQFIIIDCPPALSMLTVNAFVASNNVIIPMQCEYYALEGLSALVNTIAKVGKLLNPALRVEGILRTMYDPRNSLTKDVSNQLHSHFGDRVYQSVIPRNVRLAEAPSYGQPILQYDRSSKGAAAYLGMASELLRRSSRKAEKGRDSKTMDKL